MKTKAMPADPQSVFCEVCLKRVPVSEALMGEGRDHVAYFCGSECYERWPGPRARLTPPALEVQEGQSVSKSRDERMKRLVKQHPQRDERLAESVEPDELPKP